MCYNSAAAAKASAIQALRHGILVLLIPPLAMFIGIFGLAFCRRNRFRDQAEGAANDCTEFPREVHAETMAGEVDLLAGTAERD
jgi:hypothetical protein